MFPSHGFNTHGFTLLRAKENGEQSAANLNVWKVEEDGTRH